MNDLSSDISANAKTTKLLNLMFDAIIGITIFLFFFALSANISANLYAQTKEIGVMRLRSIGLTKIMIKLLFFYEAIVLVFTSCFLGVMIGMAIGYTMTP